MRDEEGKGEVTIERQDGKSEKIEGGEVEEGRWRWGGGGGEVEEGRWRRGRDKRTRWKKRRQ